MKFINIFLSSFLSILIFSCFKNEPVTIKYRENNPIEVLRINSTDGNIEISGWSNNSIEIITTKKLISGFPSDINNLKTIFSNNENELLINTKIPARIEGIINLKIMVPYTLLKIYVISKRGIINVNDYLGDMELANDSGDIDLIFYGNILRINSESSNINANISSSNLCDVSIINKEGNTACNIESMGDNSFLDINSINGNINISISKKLQHNLLLINKNNMIDIGYVFNKKIFINGTYNLIKGYTASYSKINLFLNNINGSIILNQF